MLELDRIEAAVAETVDAVDLPELGERWNGKVRDLYQVGDKRILITTDRVSAFDRVLGLIPFKGQVLNQLSAWWFEQTADIVANHVLEVPDPNVTVAKNAAPLPVEIVVRGYITGVTTTSLWYLYERGDRTPYGISLPDGLSKNDPLPSPIITPTTKAEKGQHDERLTRQEILARQLVDPDLYVEIETAALGLFKRGQELAAKAGLILVDTKYEFGLVDGKLTLIDEVHTPDSSRYWIADTYGSEGGPENYDKEFLRKWFAAQGYRGEGEQPIMPDSFVAQVAQRYIGAYEKLTGQTFEPGSKPILPRLRQNLRHYF